MYCSGASAVPVVAMVLFQACSSYVYGGKKTVYFGGGAAAIVAVVYGGARARKLKTRDKNL